MLDLVVAVPEIAPCHELRAIASDALSFGLAEILDGEGLPQSQYLPAFRPVVACWTRCRLIGESLAERALDGEILHQGCWNDDAEATISARGPRGAAIESRRWFGRLREACRAPRRSQAEEREQA